MLRGIEPPVALLISAFDMVAYQTTRLLMQNILHTYLRNNVTTIPTYKNNLRM